MEAGPRQNIGAKFLPRCEAECFASDCLPYVMVNIVYPAEFCPLIGFHVFTLYTNPTVYLTVLTYSFALLLHVLKSKYVMSISL